jgi:hypothetical protein
LTSTAEEPTSARDRAAPRYSRVAWRSWLVDDALRRDVALMSIAFAVLRCWAVVGRTPIRFPDSATYLFLNFFGHTTRLWTLPLLYTHLPSDRTRTLAQLAIGVACWIALAFAVARVVRHPAAARAGAALVLTLGLCIQVTEWDQLVLSESLALSLTALLIALLLRLLHRPSLHLIVGALGVLVLWVFVRHYQAAVYLAFCVPVIAWILLRHIRYAAVAVALAVIAVWAAYDLHYSVDVQRGNAHDILVDRMLKTPEGVAFFARRGLPEMAVLRKETATGNPGFASPVFRDPEWLDWIDHKWTRAYAAWLAHHPWGMVRRPLGSFLSSMSGAPPYSSVRPVLPSPVQDALWERASGDIPVWFALTAAALVVARRYAGFRRVDRFVAIGVAGAVAWYWIGWHLGSVDYVRIFVPVAATLRITLLVLILLAVDRIAAGRRRAL